MKSFLATRRGLRLAVLVPAAFLVSAVAFPALADWLVTVDGAKVATRGAWEVKGSQVVFTAPNGTYSALPLSEVNLELSERLTEAAKAPKVEEKAEEPKEKVTPVLVLTDKDIPRYEPPEEAPGETEADDESPAPAVTALDLRVANWEVVEERTGSGVTVQGSLLNPTQDAAASIRLIARVYNQDGQQVGQRYAELDRTALPPGESTDFTVTYPDVLSIGSVKFETRSARFRAAAPPSADADS